MVDEPTHAIVHLKNANVQ
jgi:hypothetical protein